MSQIKRNFIYQFIYQILAILLPIITMPYISRLFGADGIGKYSYTYTIANYVYIFSMLGFDTYGQRIIATCRENIIIRSKYFWEVYALQILSGTVGMAIYSGFIFLGTNELKLLSATQFLYVASALINIIWLFEGVEEFQKVAIRNAAVKIISVILIFTFVKKTDDLCLYSLIMSSSYLFGNLLFICYARKYVNLVRPEIKCCFRHLKSIVLVFIPQIGITIFMQMDKLMLGWWSSMRELGYYQNAEKVINIPIALILTVGIVMMPRITNLKAVEDKKQLDKYISLSMKLLMCGSIACMFGLLAISREAVAVLFGEDFAGSSGIMNWLSITVFFMAWENVLQKQYLIPMGKDKLIAVTMILAAVVNMLFNMVLIPTLGAAGAIIASIISHILICIIETIYVRRELPVISFLKDAFIFSIIGLGMLISVKIFSYTITIDILFLKLAVEILLGGLIYISLSIVVLNQQKIKWRKFLKG